MDEISCPYGSTGPRSLASLSTSGTASAEQGADAEGVYVFAALTADVFLTFDRAGSVAAPTVTTGFPIKAATNPVALRLPRGTRFRAITASSATLLWYRASE